jgi:hypothetical protein
MLCDKAYPREMRKESAQKCSRAALHLLMSVCFFALMAVGILMIVSQSRIPLAFQPFWPVFFGGAAVALFGLRAISKAGISLYKDALSVAGPFGEHRIDYRTISRVERVRRKGSKKSEKVRLTFRQLGLEKVVEITPADPDLLVCDLMGKCPHITEARSSHSKRNRSFREAKETLSPRRRRMPPVDY